MDKIKDLSKRGWHPEKDGGGIRNTVVRDTRPVRSCQIKRVAKQCFVERIGW